MTFKQFGGKQLGYHMYYFYYWIVLVRAHSHKANHKISFPKLYVNTTIERLAEKRILSANRDSARKQQTSQYFLIWHVR